MIERPIVVVSRRWREGGSEAAFVTRALAGAASRAGPVTLLVPGTVGESEPDGAFELVGMGAPGSPMTRGLPRTAVVIVDELTPDLPGVCDTGFFLSSVTAADAGMSWRRLPLVDEQGGSPVGLFVPVNPLAQRHRHHGFGFTGYLLVLSDRMGQSDHLPPAAAWLTAAFHGLYVVVIEDGIASAWKGRALRGAASVDTRMDLWRLMAHAAACIDLAPGPLVARECVESLRLGTPIIVPEAASAAAAHARASGGSTFADAWGLIEATDKLRNEANRSSAVTQGLEYANTRYGAPTAFAEWLTRRFGHTPGDRRPGSSTPVY